MADKTIFNQGHRSYTYKDPKTKSIMTLDPQQLVTLPAAVADPLLVYPDVVDTANRPKAGPTAAETEKIIKDAQARIAELEAQLKAALEKLEKKEKK